MQNGAHGIAHPPPSFLFPPVTASSAYSLRAARIEDASFLTDMLVEAANWNWTRTRPRVQLLADEHVMRYVSGWQRPGDAGTVAVSADGDLVGACWYRMMTASAPGYGYVPGGVPELTLGVKPLWRAQGLGRALLRAAVGQARAAGHARVSLSVERDNHAVKLYVSEGFRTVESRTDSDTMVRTLR